MNLSLRINTILLLLIPFFSFTQEDIKAEESIETSNFFYDSSRQKSLALTVSHQTLNTTGNNFLGQGFGTDTGFNINLKLFLYKNLFIRYNGGQTTLNVVDNSVLGNYTTSRLKERFLSLGYEFLPFGNFKLGLNFSLIGAIQLENNVENAEQQDTGNLRSYGASLQYQFAKNLSIYVAYDFRSTKTNIEVPQELESFFRIGTYNTLNIGLRYAVGNKDLFKTLSGEK